MRLLTFMGTRPEIIKLAPVVKAFEVASSVDSLVCLTAQHREMADELLPFLEIRPDFDLDIMKSNQSLPDLTSALVKETSHVIRETSPDCVVVQGDTTTAFSASLAAFYERIPVAHIEAGLRTGDIFSPWPEEANRKMIASLARLHFAPTETACENLRRENIPKQRIFTVGNTIVDAIAMVRNKLIPPASRLRATPLPEKKKIILLTCHRRESFGEKIKNILQATRRLSERDDVHIVFPVHPNPSVRHAAKSMLGGRPNIMLTPPLPYPSLLALMERASLILTDSGGIQEEAPSFETPVVVLRDKTERTEAIEKGFAFLAGADPNKIIEIASRLLDHPPDLSATKNPFGDGQASQRILKTIQDLI